MKRLVMSGLLAGAGALAMTVSMVSAVAAPESLLPPGFDDPAPAPTPAPRPSSQPRPGTAPDTNNSSGTVSAPVIQPLPSSGSVSDAPIEVPEGLPSLSELERMSPDELDQLFGLKPKADMPPGARRSMEQIGVLDGTEGGLPVGSLGRQPSVLVRSALAGIKSPMVSRWGHILLRRSLASRLEAPQGMNPAEFAGLRASALNAIGEFEVARAVAQDVDTGNWDRLLTDAAVDAYVATGDVAGTCPMVRFRSAMRKDAQWRMLQSICGSFAGEGARARTDLNRMRSRGEAPAIDALLAQRFANAAGNGRGAVTIEWDDVDELTPWRYGLALALGAEMPASLTDDLSPYYQRVAARSPALPVSERIAPAELAAREGILSSSALIDLFSQYYAESGGEGAMGPVAVQLREAYVAADPTARIAAMRSVWGNGQPDYARLVLTSYAAARFPANDAFAEDAGMLIASMLAAGLDRDALQWGAMVAEGSEGWAQLALVQPQRSDPVDGGAVASFADDDASEGQRKTRFLVAGLAGLGRLESSTVNEYSESMGLRLGQPTRWTRLIDRAGELRNQPLVAFLAGLGMQGDGWNKMTPRHLYHIVRSLDRAGLSAEARLIAAEAVARG